MNLLFLVFENEISLGSFNTLHIWTKTLNLRWESREEMVKCLIRIRVLHGRITKTLNPLQHDINLIWHAIYIIRCVIHTRLFSEIYRTTRWYYGGVGEDDRRWSSINHHEEEIKGVKVDWRIGGEPVRMKKGVLYSFVSIWFHKKKWNVFDRGGI